jgi:uncharacterized membrane protein
MAFCSKCGANVAEGVAFCGSCGAPVAGSAGAPSGGTSPAEAGMTANVAALLTYVVTPLTAILFLVLEPYNRDKFVRFHAFQSLFLGIAWVVLAIVLSIVTAMVGMIPVVGWIVAVLLWPIFLLAMFGIWILAMFKAYNNDRFALPVIGKIAEQQAG